MANACARNWNLSTLAVVLCCLGAGLAWIGRAEVAASHVQPRHVRTIPLGGAAFGPNPQSVDIHHQTGRLYVFEPRRNVVTEGRIVAVDLATETVVATATHPDSRSSSAHLAVDEGRNRLFVSGRFRAWIYDSETLALIGFLDVGGLGPRGLAVDEVNGWLYVAEGRQGGAGSVAVFRLHDLTLKGRVPVASEPSSIAVNPLLGRAYVAHGRTDAVTVVDAHALSAIDTLPTGASPCGSATPACGPGLVYDTWADRLYAAHLGGITVFDGTGALLDTFQSGGEFTLYADSFTGLFLAIDESRGLLFVRDLYSVHVIETTTGMRIGSVHQRGLAEIASHAMTDTVYGALSPRDVAVLADRATNAGPVADAGLDQTIPDFFGGTVVCPIPAHLEGAGSYDPDGDGIHYGWRQTAGPPVELGQGGSPPAPLNPTVERPEFATDHLFSSPDDPDVVLEFELVVDDGLLLSAPDTVRVTVENRCPLAAHGGPYSGVEGTPVQFDASGSADPRGLPLTYQWAFGDGGLSTDVSPAHTYARPGVYSVRMSANNGVFIGGAQTTATITPRPPEVSAIPGGTVAPGQVVTVSGVWNRTTSRREPQHFWSWDLDGDGVADDSGFVDYRTPVVRTTSFAEPGVHTLTLTVQRSVFGEPAGDPVSASLSIAVEAPLPTSKDQCKQGGWTTFGVFKNQGDCVSYVATGGENPPSGL